MLSDEQFRHWCDRLKLPEQTEQIVLNTRTSEPVRKVKGTARNVCGPYSSKKMGRTIQFESHTVELPALISFYEYDDDVLEYWDQPYQFTLKCSPTGKRANTIPYVPDFLVIRTDSVGFEEWKPEKTLVKKAEKYSYRYICDENGQWQDILAKEQCEKLGFYFRLRTDSEIDWTRYRNLKYLGKYLDGYLNQKYIVEEEVEVHIREIVENHPGISLSQLLEKIKIGTIDDINALIAGERIYVDLSAVSLVDRHKVSLYRDEATAQAYIIASKNYSQPVNSSLETVEIKIGSSFLLDGKCLTVEHMGDSKIILRGQEGLIRWTHQEFQQLVELGEISNLQTEETHSLDSLVEEYFNSASPQALAEANRRYSILEPYLKEQLSPPLESDTPKRTIRYWKAKYKKAQQEYGCGFIGLIPQRKGNPTSRYSAEDLAFVDEIIDKEYESFKQKKIWAVYEILKARWHESKRISPVPSHTFLYERIKNRPKHKTTRKRKGSRAANNFLGSWLIQPTTPRHGDRPLEIVHIDHTLLEIECICPDSKVNLGRPWVTAMIDAYSRRILAVYLTFDAPSYRSCMMILRICVQRFKRFPEWIVVDNGKDFKSTYFDTLLARFEASKKHRPKDVPKFSSIIERWFRTTETEFFNNLRGNTQIMKEVRLAKKQNNPKNLAVWELDELYDYFVSGYCYGVYDRKEHAALEGMSPQQAFEFGMAKTGSRPHQTIRYDEQFKILTLPSTKKGTAKVQPSKGVRINRTDYWSDEFYAVENKDIPIRYDPFDYGTAYAYVNNRWIRCISNYYTKLQGYSERAIKIATTLIHRKKQLHNQKVYASVGEIVHLLKNAEQYEDVQRQLQRDRSTQRVHDLIEGKLNTSDNTSINTGNKRHDSSSNINSKDLFDDPSNLELNQISEDEVLDNEFNSVDDDRDILAYDDDELW